MPKGKQTKTAIYHPPKSGMPYLVGTVSPEGVTAIAVESKEEATQGCSRRTEAVPFLVSRIGDGLTHPAHFSRLVIGYTCGTAH
jgi:hypothetical protein